MLEDMPSSLLSEWLEYAKLEPFGQPWENWLMAVPSHMYASTHTPKNKPAPPFEKFFYVDSATKRKERNDNFIGFLRSKVKKQHGT